ncbi:MAG: tRNA (adenosine(37)-N6)-dimethylallyltransferase MiaA [Alphaproteobacteria bacterium]|nr:MAG: tRNA (adenosine(37)-N6)-dimethylallyltransferase MiaA [Alphaproteobacteria bacterium]
MPKVILIAGPTASGKSALSLYLAERFDGEIINADSMQVYDCLQVLTARPSQDEMAGIPHHLYGVIPPADAYSVAYWARDAVACIDDVLQRGKSAILVGGTGLYFKALVEGLSAVPEIGPTIRKAVRGLIASSGVLAVYDQLTAEDPVMAARLDPADRQRISRALEVIRSTGRSLADWQSDEKQPALLALDHDIDLFKIILLPDRDWLYARCDLRFTLMLDQGALEEVKAMSGLDPQLPAMRALGVMQLAAYLADEMTREEAIEKAQTATRQYAKRQMTWFRNQFSDWNVINEKDSERIRAITDNIII